MKKIRQMPNQSQVPNTTGVPFIPDYRRFAPVSSDADVTLYWIRTNAQGSDNAAIQNTALDTQYR